MDESQLLDVERFRIDLPTALLSVFEQLHNQKLVHADKCVAFSLKDEAAGERVHVRLMDSVIQLEFSPTATCLLDGVMYIQVGELNLDKPLRNVDNNGFKIDNLNDSAQGTLVKVHHAEGVTTNLPSICDQLTCISNEYPPECQPDSSLKCCPSYPVTAQVKPKISRTTFKEIRNDRRKRQIRKTISQPNSALLSQVFTDEPPRRQRVTRKPARYREVYNAGEKTEEDDDSTTYFEVIKAKDLCNLSDSREVATSKNSHDLHSPTLSRLPAQSGPSCLPALRGPTHQPAHSEESQPVPQPNSYPKRRPAYSREANIQCKICNKFYKDDMSLKGHVTRYHSDAPETVDYLCELREACKVTCGLCGRTLVNRYNEMKVHMVRVHGKDDPFLSNCGQCGMQFRRSFLLKEHIRRQHPNHDRVLCHSCPATFKLKEYLTEHIKNKHTSDTQWRCDICHKVISSAKNLRRHQKLHQGALYRCEVCDKVFHEQGNYRRHIKFVHNPGEVERHACMHCTREFTTKHNLTQHINMVHLKTSPYYCDICKKYFARGKLLLEHARVFHPNIPVLSTNSPLNRSISAAQLKPLPRSAHPKATDSQAADSQAVDSQAADCHAVNLQATETQAAEFPIIQTQSTNCEAQHGHLQTAGKRQDLHQADVNSMEVQLLQQVYTEVRQADRIPVRSISATPSSNENILHSTEHGLPSISYSAKPSPASTMIAASANRTPASSIGVTADPSLEIDISSIMIAQQAVAALEQNGSLDNEEYITVIDESGHEITIEIVKSCTSEAEHSADALTPTRSPDRHI